MDGRMGLWCCWTQPAFQARLKAEWLLNALQIDTGRIVCRFGTSGRDVIRSVTADRKMMAVVFGKRGK
jgi:hypothetical protein